MGITSAFSWGMDDSSVPQWDCPRLSYTSQNVSDVTPDLPLISTNLNFNVRLRIFPCEAFNMLLLFGDVVLDSSEVIDCQRNILGNHFSYQIQLEILCGTRRSFSLSILNENCQLAQNKSNQSLLCKINCLIKLYSRFVYGIYSHGERRKKINVSHTTFAPQLIPSRLSDYFYLQLTAVACIGYLIR